MWNEKATGYVLSEDLEIRSPTNEELINNSCKNGAIIAVVTGTHFVPGGLSRNKRYYPEDMTYGRLWSEQLSKPWVTERLANNTMYGTIGHDTEITEKELREGKVSHFTKMLKIIPTGDPKKPYKGYAESYILNTPAGNLLKTYLESSKLFVSSRADGDFLPGATYKVAEDGSEVPVLDPAKFRLERFDFVLNPGFFDAHPTLKEDLGLTEGLLKTMNEAYQECEKHLSENSIKETDMSGAMGNELINKSAGDVVIQLDDTNQITFSKVKATPNKAAGTDCPHNKGATATADTNKDGAAEVDFDDKGQNTLTEKIVAEIVARNEELQRQVAQLTEAVASDAKPDINDMTKAMLAKNLTKIDPQHIADSGLKGGHGSRDELVASIKKVESRLNEFHGELGSPEEIAEALREVYQVIEACGGVGNIFKDRIFHEQYGSPEDIAETIHMFHEFSSVYGTPDKIMATFEHYAELGDDFGNHKDLVEFAQYAKTFFEQYGTPEEIVQQFENVQAFFDEYDGPTAIRESLAMLADVKNRIDNFEQLGVSNLSEMKAVLQELQEVKLKNEALAIAEHTGLNSDRVEEHLRKGMTEKQIVEFYNKMSDNYYGRYLTVREDVTGSPLDKIPLKTVDSDGNHVQLQNASYKISPDKNTSILETALSGISHGRRMMSYKDA